MKRILVVLGGIFAFILLVGIIGFLVLNFFGRRLDKESKAYVDEVIPIIATSWNSKDLLDRASPELIQVAPTEKIESLFHAFSEKLGPLREYKGSRGDAKLGFTPQMGKITTADYVAEAIFEKAPAKINVRTILHNGTWQILQFYVNSEALLPGK